MSKFRMDQHDYDDFNARVEEGEFSTDVSRVLFQVSKFRIAGEYDL